MKRINLASIAFMLGLLALGGIIFSPLAINAADTPVQDEVIEVQPETTETQNIEHPDWCDKNHNGTHHNDNRRSSENGHHRNHGGRRCH